MPNYREKQKRCIYRIALLSTVIVFACLIPVSYSHAQEIFSTVKITSSPNPVGSGARAQGMGGAFIAVADDATAASWNPGGLMQLERPEFSIVGSFFQRRKHETSDLHSEENGQNNKHREDINYMSGAYPFRAFDKNMVVSFNYQRLYDFYDKLDFNYNYRGYLSDGSFYNVQTKTRFRQQGALKAFAPAYAIQITPRLSVGITLNFWTNHLGYNNGWDQERKTTGTAFIHTMRGNLLKYTMEEFYKEKNENFEAFNTNLGFLWHVSRIVTIGGVLKTPYTADVDRKTYAVSQTFPPGSGLPPPVPYRKNENIDIRFPMSYGLGVAFRLSDAFTVDLDVYRTEWSKFYAKSGNGKKTNIAGDPWKESHPHDTTQVRLGGEYLFITEKTLIPARFGLFYDPEPAAGHPKDYYGVSVGTGVMLGRVVLDCCYIYRWARDVKAEIPDTKKDDAQHNFLMSMIIHF